MRTGNCDGVRACASLLVGAAALQCSGAIEIGDLITGISNAIGGSDSGYNLIPGVRPKLGTVITVR